MKLQYNPSCGSYFLTLPRHCVRHELIQKDPLVDLIDTADGRLLVDIEQSRVHEKGLHYLKKVYGLYGSSYRILVPCEWVKRLGLEPGDAVDVVQDENLRLVYTPRTPKLLRDAKKAAAGVLGVAALVGLGYWWLKTYQSSHSPPAPSSPPPPPPGAPPGPRDPQ